MVVVTVTLAAGAAVAISDFTSLEILLSDATTSAAGGGVAATGASDAAGAAASAVAAGVGAGVAVVLATLLVDVSALPVVGVRVEAVCELVSLLSEECLATRRSAFFFTVEVLSDGVGVAAVSLAVLGVEDATGAGAAGAVVASAVAGVAAVGAVAFASAVAGAAGVSAAGGGAIGAGACATGVAGGEWSP